MDLARYSSMVNTARPLDIVFSGAWSFRCFGGCPAGSPQHVTCGPQSSYLNRTRQLFSVRLQKQAQTVRADTTDDYGPTLLRRGMESPRNGSAADAPLLHATPLTRASSSPVDTEGSARLYIIILISFYGVFLIAIMIGYLRSKQREKRRTNVFTRLLHEEEQREWGASLKKHSCASLVFPPFSNLRPAHVPLPAGLESKVLSPLACGLCAVEQSSVSSLCSSADARLAIEEEGDSGTGEGLEDPGKGSSDNSDGSAENLKESL
ncbi:potassium voltage-gated channel subfamily E member 4 [Sardina pilchardus]|uniref:potassium voltage-gated channel subfamily E member 4 n=1 Tax=Sardina pilchardus TaxID=27697 RepID=UPI002E0EB970